MSLAAFRQFKTYPLQSLLIALAVALGVAVVTAVAATFNQYNAQLNSSLLSQRQITLQTKENDWSAFYNGGESVPVREVGLSNEKKVSLTPEDLAPAKKAAPTVDYAYLQRWNVLTVERENETFDLEVTDMTQDFLAAAEVKLSQGGLPSESDFREKRRVILLSEVALKKLSVTGDPVGQSVSLSNFDGENSYTILGVVEGNEYSADGFANTYVPYTPSPWDAGAAEELTFAVADQADLVQARTELQAYAEKTWGARVTVASLGDWNIEGQFRLIAVVIAAFASTALAAAALNIMNLMLARVLKQRHSIGILRSLGATRSSILWQFLNESLLLGALGGVFGVAAGYGLYSAFSRYQLAVYGDDYATFIAAFPWLALPAGFATALLTSLLFGFYPAWQASRLRPVEALRDV